MNRKLFGKTLIVAALALISCGPALAEGDAQSQIDAIKGVIPKFAIPMREVGDRFQNMHFAVEGGNWALAAYMSKYMNGAMKPASLTKPKEYESWKKFYEESFAPVNAAIQAKDKKGFESAYTKVMNKCSDCHEKMDYGFIKVVKMKMPADAGIEYKLNSEPDAVPK